MSALWELFDFRPELLPTAITLANEHILTAALSSRHLFDEALFIKALSRATANADEWDATLIASIVMSHPNATEPVFKAAAELLRSSYSPYDGGQEVADLAISSRAARRENGPVTYPITIPWEQLPEESLALVLEAYKASEYRYPTLFTWESAGRVFGPEPKDPHLAETFIYQTALDQIGDGGGYISTSCISQEQLSNEIERPLDAIGYKAWQAFIELSINWSLSTAELLQTTLGLF